MDKKRFSVPGYPFYCKNEAQRDRAIALVAAQAERRKNSPPKPITHGHGDPHSDLPGERPEAYDPNLSQEDFDRQFTGDLDSVEYIICRENKTQSHGKLLPGFTPVKRFKVDENGMVVADLKAAE